MRASCVRGAAGSAGGGDVSRGMVSASSSAMASVATGSSQESVEDSDGDVGGVVRL